MSHPAVGLSGFGVYGVAANIALPCVGADACIRPGRLRRGGVPGPISGLRAGPCGPVGLRNAPAGAVRASAPTGDRTRLRPNRPHAAPRGFGGMRASRPTTPTN